MKKQNRMGDKVCGHQNAFMLDNWFRRLLQNPARILRHWIKKGDHVMDVGCGPGFFSIEMARKVGEQGAVIAADLQVEMLDMVKGKADKHELSERMVYHRCMPDRIGLDEGVGLDFILAYYMVHETPDPTVFLLEMKRYLKADGKILIVEPRFHVNRRAFEKLIALVKESGYTILEQPRNIGGRALLLGLGSAITGDSTKAEYS